MIRTKEDFAKAFKAARRVSVPLIAIGTSDPASAIHAVRSALDGSASARRGAPHDEQKRACGGLAFPQRSHGTPVIVG